MAGESRHREERDGEDDGRPASVAREWRDGEDDGRAAMTLVTVPMYLAGSRLAYVKALKKDPCSYCALKSHSWREGTVDHITARGEGGTDRMDNLTGSCPACNSRKGTRSLLLYLLARTGDC